MIKIKLQLLLLILTGCSIACRNINQSQDNSQQEFFKTDTATIQDGGVQMVDIPTAKGNFKVWTKKIGNNPKMKLLLLGGGPGLSHEYLECMESFMPAEGIEIIYYDQLGTGYSDNPKDTSLWDLPRYVEEVELVRKALHLDSTNLYLFGHSWGGVLGIEYALKYQKNLKGLIVSNMMSSASEYAKYANNVLAKQFDPKVLARIREIEAKGDFENPEYMNLLIPNFYAKHLCRIPTDQWPNPLNRSSAGINNSLYVTMQGPSEFGISGKLLKWERTADLAKITVPTLTIGAKHDTMDPKYLEQMAKTFANGQYLYCNKGSHLSMYDDQQTYMKGLIKFIKEVDDK